MWGSDHDYTETNGWNFAFHTPQDGQGLANLYGGRGELAKKLDTFFATPETAGYPGSYGGIIHEMREARDVRMGQWGFSNQVSHHIPWMYSYTGQPWKTQEAVRIVANTIWKNAPDGIPGNDDLGEMSSWYVWAALGMYPEIPGRAELMLGSPLFPHAVIHGSGGDVTVISTGSIQTIADDSVSVLAQSIGGGGGNAAFAISAQTGAVDGSSVNVGGSSAGVGGAKGKLFAIIADHHHGEEAVGLLIKASGPDEMTGLIEAQPEIYYWPKYYGASGWLGLKLNRRDVDWEQVREWLERSWRACAPPRLTKLMRAAEEF